MAPTLHVVYPSPPVRAVLITAKAIDLNLNLKEVDFFNGEHLTPDYRKMNPQHTVPTLVDDDGFTVWDSHAIITYLVSKYAKNDALYPKDVKKRAVIDQRLHFESGVIFTSLLNITVPLLRGTRNSIDDSQKERVHEGYQFLEDFLGREQWAAGDSVSVADYSLIASISSLNVLIPIDEGKYPRLRAWMKKVEALPEYEANKKGLDGFEELFNSKLAK